MQNLVALYDLLTHSCFRPEVVKKKVKTSRSTSRKMAASESETPVKMCLTAIEKKVRNLEKRKVSTMKKFCGGGCR